MSLPLPSSLSPSKVSSFTNCALSFRFSAIDRLPEPPSVAATRGSLVHAALERLFCLEPAERDIDAALRCLADAARSEEHTSELQSLMRNSYAVFCLQKKNII